MKAKLKNIFFVIMLAITSLTFSQDDIPSDGDLPPEFGGEGDNTFDIPPVPINANIYYLVIAATILGSVITIKKTREILK